MKKAFQIVFALSLFVLGTFTTSQAQSLQAKQAELERAIKGMGIQDYQITLNEVRNNRVVATTSASSRAFSMTRLKRVYKYENGAGDASAQRVSLYIQKDGNKWSIFIKSGANLTASQLESLTAILNK